jgi:hypothetical protein
MSHLGHCLFLTGCTFLSVIAASGTGAEPKVPGSAAPPKLVASARKLKARDRIAVGDRWRVRVSRYPMQLPEPHWETPETWVFSAMALERAEEGPRLMVTATREGETKPAMLLQIDPETQAIVRLDIMLPVRGGESAFTERATASEPFVSDLSPMPITGVVPPTARDEAGNRTMPPAGDDPGNRVSAAGEEAGDRVVSEKSGEGSDGAPMDGEKAGSKAASQPEGFVFGRRFTERSEPVDAGVGRARIQRGMSEMAAPYNNSLEPFGVPRFMTVIEGSGLRVEQIWDETTPWPIYSQTDTSRSWLVAYTRGKSS